MDLVWLCWAFPAQGPKNSVESEGQTRLGSSNFQASAGAQRPVPEAEIFGEEKNCVAKGAKFSCGHIF